MTVAIGGVQTKYVIESPLSSSVYTQMSLIVLTCSFYSLLLNGFPSKYQCLSK